MLINENERAWYDSHREAFLRGGDHTKGEAGSTVCHSILTATLSCYHAAGCRSLLIVSILVCQ
jgi:hypothetical protein